MKSIVITGSTRGIGYGLADAFLGLGCEVTINGRTEGGVERARNELSLRHKSDNVLGCAGDVTRFVDVEALWNAANARFGKVDIWINNAGIAHPQLSFWNHPPERIRAVVDTNVVGAMNGAAVALRRMVEQGFGSFYNMEGLGSSGRKVQGLTLYGTTKYGLRYLTDALVEETKGTHVLVGALRPGMVITDLITQQFEGRPEEWERAKRIFNIIADRVQKVTPWLARKILANRKTGVRIYWLTPARMMARFLLSPFRKRDLFADEAR
jgi:NAD(P)-dependent dehydrogenase (short-subunit alcohol dehydrogenase family)